MILIFHQNGNAEGLSCNKKLERQSIADALLTVANQHPDEFLVWCHAGLKKYLNIFCGCLIALKILKGLMKARQAIGFILSNIS